MRPATRLGVFLLVMAGPLAFVVLPILTFLLYSLWSVENHQIIRHASAANYVAFFQNDIYVGVFFQTLLLCAKVTIAGLVVGYPIAYFLWRQKSSRKYLLLLLFILPLFMSYIVKIYTMRSILGLNGFLNQILVGSGLLEKPSLLFLYNQTAILITMSVIFLPFLILPIFLSLERIPRNLVQASADLGAGPGTTFRHVIVPLSLPGVVAGCLFTFVLALGDFVTPQMVGGPTGFTFGRVIQSQFGLAFDWPFGAALGAILLGVALLVIIGAGLAMRQRRI